MPALTDRWTFAGLELPNRVALAPLAGIGNWFVRLQARRYGAGLVVSDGLELRRALPQRAHLARAAGDR
jgi:tRNA-dihydrouridine synthase